MARTVTVTKEIFTFAELSDSAKEYAAEKYNITNDSGWWDSVYYDFMQIIERMGFSVESHNIEFRLSYSQGDYAAFSGKYFHRPNVTKEVKAYAQKDKTLQEIAQRLSKMQRPYFYSLSASFSYSNYHGYSVDMEDHRQQYSWVTYGDAEREFREILKDLSKWLYSTLQRDCEFLSSAEYFEEMADVNDWEFYENGKMVA